MKYEFNFTILKKIEVEAMGWSQAIDMAKKELLKLKINPGDVVKSESERKIGRI